ncbi:MAG: hypothetical protein ACXITR_00375 [Cyanobacterium sp.]
MKINLLTQILITIFISSFLVSCADARVSGCRQLTKSISPLEEKLQGLDDTNLESILDTAQTFELTSQALTNQTFEDDSLQSHSLRLSGVYQEYADNTRSFVDAYEKKDQDKAIFYQQRIIDLFLKQEEVLQVINSYCL